MVIVQAVTTIWTKTSRGAPLATRRSATPESVALPLVPDDPAILVQSVVFLESNGFEPSAGCWDRVADLPEPESHALERRVGWTELVDLPLIIRGVRVSGDGDRVLIERLPEVLPGWPNRDQGRIVQIRPSSWSRVIWNRRHAGDRRAGHGEWTYAKVVLNVANRLDLDPAMFRTQPPARIVDQSASLA